MFEFGLRILVVFLCAAVITSAAQVAVWAVRPWVYEVRTWLSPAFQMPQTVSIGRVDLIEGDKIKSVEGRTISRQLSHLVTQIYDTLTRNLEADYKTLTGAGYSVVDTTVRGGQIFSAQTGEQVTFEVEIFKFDVAGLLNYFQSALSKSDSVSALIEITEKSSRVFVEVSPVKGPSERLIEETESTLQDALERAACAIARSYLGRDRVFDGLSTKAFCAYVEALQDVQNFIRISAGRVRRGEAFDLTTVQSIAAPFETEPLGTSDCAIVHLMRASLYRLGNRHSEALAQLELAERTVPDHPFVTSNLAAWRREEADRRRARDLIDKQEVATAGQIAETYRKLADQPALRAINYAGMRDAFLQMERPGHAKIAVLDTGYTQAGEAPDGYATILPSESFVDGEGPDDGAGHGTFNVNLLAALLPVDNADIVPIKVLSNDGFGTELTILSGMDRALQIGATLICANLGGSGRAVSVVYQRVVDVANDSGAFVVAAAGNGSRRAEGYVAPVDSPANTPGAIAVGGSDQAGNWADFSPGPDGVGLVLPAVDVLTTQDGVEVRAFSGTTFSNVIGCALVAAAQIVDPALTRERLMEMIARASKEIVPGGPKILDALEFIHLVAEGRQSPR